MVKSVGDMGGQVRMENQSRRIVRTKSHLKTAFIELIEEKGYSHVTVTDIVKRALYNRTTFYHYYIDKQHITEELQNEMVEAIKKTSMDKYQEGDQIQVSSMGPHSFELIYFIEQNKNYFNLLLKADTIPNMHHDLPNAIYQILDEQFEFVSDMPTMNTPAHKRYMAHGTSGLIVEWIKNGYDLTPEMLSKELINILQTMAKGFVVKKSDRKKENEW
ncbi:transcriptional regulator, TetR family [Domibacillus enclensis]|uniref:Transcriptional regulator, TetR family n=3 Tax=Domibacillus enclensis TaxID=1017273 RepID=A0A1N7ADQ6_9BACI|nr:transcriptional regulator, TetR family [Domibacillus enclensis]